MSLPKENTTWFWRNFYHIAFGSGIAFVIILTTIIYFGIESEYVELFGSKDNPTCNQIEQKYSQIQSKIIKVVIADFYMGNCTEIKQSEEEIMKMLEKGV